MRYNNDLKSGGKRQIVLFLLAALALTACGGGSSTAGTSNKSQAVHEISDNINWEENDIGAIVFIGYGKDFPTISQTDHYEVFRKRFPSLRKTTRFTVETEGDEVFYIIPRFSDATITVKDYVLDLDDGVKEVIDKTLYEGKSTPLLIRCNLSDLHPNITVTITGNGRAETFNPVSSFDAWNYNYLQFISLIDESEFETVREGFSLEHVYQGVFAGITAKVINGEVTLSYDHEEAVYALSETEVVINDTYAIEGLSGVCKGVFIGDVGQDYNPILCCLLEDGGVEVLSLYQALRNYDFSTSGRLHGHNDVISVSNEGVGGEEGGGYITLFTSDATGNKKEIDFNAFLNGEWIYETHDENGYFRYIIYLSADWKITYIYGLVDSEALEMYMGTCHILEESETVIIYEYEMKEPDRAEMTGQAPDPTVKKGTFKAQMITDDWFDGINITCLSGLKFHPGAFGEKALFKNKYQIDRGD